MKAIVYKKFGHPEVLQIKEVKKHIPKGNEVLIRIYAATVAKEDFTKSNQTYDIIFDAVAKSSFSTCKKLLNPNGIYLTTGNHH